MPLCYTGIIMIDGKINSPRRTRSSRDPAYQRRGYASALTDFALAWLKDAGMAVAMVETGGDPGHAPARRTYERCGFRLLPVARYFMKL